jgi:hypothetical protein
VAIFGIDNDRNLFIPDQAPKFDSTIPVQIDNTYDNYACGINIKYPSDWRFTEASPTYRQKADTTEIAYFYPRSSLVASDISSNFVLKI